MKKQIMFWISALVALFVIVYLLGSTLTPFAAGMVLAYLLDPFVRKINSWGISRLWATVLIMSIFVVFFILAMVTLVPLIVHQMSNFIEVLPTYISKLQSTILEITEPWLEKLHGSEVVPPDLRTSVKNLVGQGVDWFGTFLKSLWSGGQALISIISLFIVTPIVAFYLLLDWNDMVQAIDTWLPRKHQETIRSLCKDIDSAVAGCIRGQFSVCLILGSFYSIGLSLIGLNFGAFIGMMAGILSFIPYVGSTLGLFIALGVAVSQFWPEWMMIFITVAVFATGQFFEGNFLSPKIVGQSAGLHPVWLMFALLAFGSLFGFVGLLIALPLAAAIGVLTRFALKQYLASQFYSGGIDWFDSFENEKTECISVIIKEVPSHINEEKEPENNAGSV